MTPLLAQRPRPDRQFERLYRKHVGDVYRYALAVLHNQADAEDVTQTTFLNAYRAFQKGERPDVPKNWLIAIAHNVCRQRFRQSSRRPNEVAFIEEIAPAVEEVDERYSVEEIQRALGQLQFNQRSALVMRELEGRTYGDIAQILGLTVGAVETLIFRARRALREQLEGSLSCSDAELALSRDADGVLPRAEKGALRAHLRECKSCATAARRQRAQRGALKALGAAPVPGPLLGWITSLLGGGSAAAGSSVAVKAGAVTGAGLLVAGGGIEGKQLVERHNLSVEPQAAQAAKPKLKAKAKPAPEHAAVARFVSAAPSVPAAVTVSAVSAKSGEDHQGLKGQGEDHKGQDQKGQGDDNGSSTSAAETDRHDAAQRDDHSGKQEDAKHGDGSGKNGDGEHKQPAATAGDSEHKDGAKRGTHDGGSVPSGSSGHDSSGEAPESDHSGSGHGENGDGAVSEPEQPVPDVLPGSRD